MVYVEHGDLRIDNNRVENVIRPLVIGRKSFLYCNSVVSAPITAVQNSSAGCCND
ncbi:MAG: IS66 family transposase [Pseudomonadales bacterium]